MRGATPKCPLWRRIWHWLQTGRGGMRRFRGHISPTYPPSQTDLILMSSPPAKGRAHEASCSVGRGAVSVLPFRKRGAEAAEARQRRAPSAAHPCPRRAVLKAGEGQPRLARTGKPAPGPWWSRGRLVRKEAASPSHSAQAGPEQKLAAAGARLSAPSDYWPGTHRAPATPSHRQCDARRSSQFDSPGAGSLAGTESHVRARARDRNWWAS